VNTLCLHHTKHSVNALRYTLLLSKLCETNNSLRIHETKLLNVKPRVHTIKKRFEWLGIRIMFVCKRETQLQEQELVYLSQRDVPLKNKNTKSDADEPKPRIPSTLVCTGNVCDCTVRAYMSRWR
jgi:hypothetical protein